MARITERFIKTLIPADNQRVPESMPRGATVQSYRLRFTGTLTVGVAVATILADSPLGYLRSLDLLLGGSFVLRGHDARAIRVLNTLQYGQPPLLTPPLGAIGASNFAAELTLDLWQPDFRALGLDRAFWLDSRLLTQLDIVPSYGAAADVATPGGGGTAVLSALALGITAVEVQDQGGLLSRMQILRQVVQNVAATGVLDITPFKGQGVIYRGFLLHTTSGNVDPNRATSDDTIIGDVTVQDSRGTRHVDAVPWAHIQAETARTYGLTGGMPAGWAFIDFAKGHNLADILQTRGMQDVSMRLTIAAAPANSFVQIYPVVALLRQTQRSGTLTGAGAGGPRVWV